MPGEERAHELKRGVELLACDEFFVTLAANFENGLALGGA